MGSLAGGMLGRPELALRDIVSDAIQTSRAGLQFVLANPAVSAACSGMTTMAQLAENLQSISSPPGSAMWDEVRAVFERFNAIGKTLCTGCNYCRPCPSGVDISRNLRIRNYHAIYAGDGQTAAATAARQAYAAIPTDQRAAECNQCGTCETKCPNKLPVRDLLAETAKALG